MRLRQSFNCELQPKQNKPQISLCAFPAWSKYYCCPRRNENIAMKDGNTARLQSRMENIIFFNFSHLRYLGQ